jgi:hypothetical protein
MMHGRGQIWSLIALTVCATLAVCVGLSSCGQALGASTVGSGVEGITEAEPQCPISAPGAVCPPKPVSETVAVLDANGGEVTRFTSAHDGSFRISIAPGQYTLAEVVGTAGAPPSLKPVTVTVPPEQFVHVVLMFDTGIR